MQNNSNLSLYNRGVINPQNNNQVPNAGNFRIRTGDGIVIEINTSFLERVQQSRGQANGGQIHQ